MIASNSTTRVENWDSGSIINNVTTKSSPLTTGSCLFVFSLQSEIIVIIPFQYWPSRGTETYGVMCVTLTDTQELATYVIRTFQLQRVSSAHVRHTHSMSPAAVSSQTMGPKLCSSVCSDQSFRCNCYGDSLLVVLSSVS